MEKERTPGSSTAECEQQRPLDPPSPDTDLALRVVQILTLELKRRWAAPEFAHVPKFFVFRQILSQGLTTGPLVSVRRRGISRAALIDLAMTADAAARTRLFDWELLKGKPFP